jgi:prepilin-type N-terminal cleavage/methylation domain-containing protein
MKRIVNNRGLTLVEIIMTLALLGALICPFVFLTAVINLKSNA